MNNFDPIYFTIDEFRHLLQEFRKIKHARDRSLKEICLANWLTGQLLPKKIREKLIKDNPKNGHSNIDHIPNVHIRAWRRLKPYLGQKVDQDPQFKQDSDTPLLKVLIERYARHQRDKDLYFPTVDPFNIDDPKYKQLSKTSTSCKTFVCPYQEDTEIYDRFTSFEGTTKQQCDNGYYCKCHDIGLISQPCPKY